MGKENIAKEMSKAWALGATCVFIFCAILVAGLWPFTPHPANRVSWAGNGYGIRFGKRGIIFSSGAFKTTTAAKNAACSLEIWLQPFRDDVANTILTFFTPENPERFKLRQYLDGLLVQREIRDQQNRLRTSEMEIEHIFRQKKQAFVTVTSGAQGTTVYADGVLVAMSPHFGLSSQDFSGQLVLGASPIAYDTWSGQLRGLAIYNQELSATEVLRHYHTWTETGQAEIAEKEGIVAVYRFAEQAGKVIHNRADSGPDLYIPEHFLILRKPFLEPPWKEFRLDRTYFKDVIINVAGFIPLGFFFCTFLSSTGHSNRPRFATIILGGTVSLTIEILQAYLPTRSSGMTDILTNTLGTGIGVILFSLRPLQALLAKIAILIKQQGKALGD